MKLKKLINTLLILALCSNFNPKVPKSEQSKQSMNSNYKVTETCKNNPDLLEYCKTINIADYYNLIKKINVDLDLVSLGEKKEIIAKIETNDPYLSKLLKKQHPEEEEKAITAMALYIVANERFRGFWQWVDKLEKGTKKEREKALKYKQKNSRKADEDYLIKSIETILNAKEKGVDWIGPEVLGAQSLLESILGLIPYGTLDEVGLFHGRIIVEKENAKKYYGAKTKEDVEKILLDPEKALTLYNLHMKPLVSKVKASGTEAVIEIFGRYNAGKYWKKYGQWYVNQMTEIIKSIAAYKIIAKANRNAFLSHYRQFANNKNEFHKKGIKTLLGMRKEVVMSK